MDGGNDMKVGFGDCYAPGPGGAQDHLRFLFLERVRVQCPAMLRELQENLKVHDGDKGYLSPFDDEVRLSWDPTVETESAFSKRARRSLAEYRARTKHIAEQAGFQPVPRRSIEHLDWLVSWQAKKLSRREIADRANVSQDAVKKATKRLAKEMGLTFR